MNISDFNTFDPNALHTKSSAQGQIFLWGVAGLAPKQELILKSMMRLIDHKLDHKWFHSTTAMDLCMYAADFSGMAASACRDAKGGLAHVLTLGAEKRGKTDFLSLPLYAADLLQTVNQIGHVIQLKKYAASEIPLVNLHNMRVLSNSFLRLKHWPPAHLVGTPDRIRMATLLNGSSLVMQELQHRSGYPLAACEAFVKDLVKAGLLELSQGLQQSVPVSTPSAAVEPSASLAPAKPGLLDKIKMRLRLGVGAQP